MYDVADELKCGTLEYMQYYSKFEKKESLIEIPKEYKKASFKDYKYSQQIIEFINDKNAVFLWINGGVGSGKTYGIYALENYFMAGNLTCHYEHLSRPVQRRINFVEEYSLIDAFNANKKFYHSNILAIDDVGLITSGGVINFITDIYHNIIDYRRKYGNKTIFTSNLSPEGWFKILGTNDQVKAARISSRLSGCTIQLKLDGIDNRKKS